MRSKDFSIYSEGGGAKCREDGAKNNGLPRAFGGSPATVLRTGLKEPGQKGHQSGSSTKFQAWGSSNSDQAGCGGQLLAVMCRKEGFPP